MANTYTQLHIHLVFAVKYRQALIGKGWKERLHQYVTGIIRDNGHKMLQINSMPDHIHILIGLRPNQSLAELVKLIKSGSSKWISQHGLSDERFAWQEGYGAFAYSHSQVQNVIRYIANQEVHHAGVRFKDEFRKILKDQEVSFEEKYLFSELL